jgi:hypothetical protein
LGLRDNPVRDNRADQESTDFVQTDIEVSTLNAFSLQHGCRCRGTDEEKQLPMILPSMILQNDDWQNHEGARTSFAELPRRLPGRFHPDWHFSLNGTRK